MVAGTSVLTVTLAYGTSVSDRTTRSWIVRGDMLSARPRRLKRSSRRGVVAAGIGMSGPFSPFLRLLRAVICWPQRAAASRSETGRRSGSSFTMVATRFSTSGSPLRSSTGPRGAWTVSSRTRLSRACLRYWSPERTCRYQRRKKTMPNSAKARTPRTATRSASCGGIGREAPPPGFGGLQGGRGAPPRRWDRWRSCAAERRQAAGRVRPAPAPARVVGQGRHQPAAHDRVDDARDERVQQDRREDLPHEQEAHRRVDPEQELDHRVADRRQGGRGRADGERHDRALRVPQLEQAAGPVPDRHVDERGEPERLHEREVDEQADAEAEDGARDRTDGQADRGDHERREVGIRAEELDLRDGGDLEDHHREAEHDEPGDELRGDRDHVALRVRVRTWTKSRRRMLANGRTWMSWSSVAGSSTRVTRPIGIRGGYSDVTRSVRDCVPAVMTFWPGVTSSLRSVKRITRSLGRPASTWIVPPTPLSAIRAPTATVWSVSSVTIAELGVAVETTPTRPSGPTTGWLGSTPSFEPLLMSTWLHHRFGSWPITRAATGCSSFRPRARSRFRRPRSCWFSRAAAAPVTACSRSALRSARSCLTSPLASIVSPTQPTRSRTGLSARLAPSWIGETTSTTPRCTACRPPPADSPK